MTLFTFEGKSRTGKSTTLDILMARRPEWIEVVGPSLPERTATDFEEAWRQEMQLRKPIFEANPDNVFVANRQFSEVAYAHDDDVRDYVIRTLAMWDGVHVIMFQTEPKELRRRNSPDLDMPDSKYQVLTDAFPTRWVDTTDDKPMTVADQVENYIDKVMS